MKIVTTIITGLIFLNSLDCYAQYSGTDSLRNKSVNNQFDPSKDFMRSWAYFDLADTIELRVIHHIPATMDCSDDIKTFSITIGTIKRGDTIRVIELCNRSKNYRFGDKVSVAPAGKPGENYIHPGVFVQGYPGQLRPGYYDTKVLRTTYGVLKPKQEQVL